MGLSTGSIQYYKMERKGGASFVLLKVMGPPVRIFAPHTEDLAGTPACFHPWFESSL